MEVGGLKGDEAKRKSGLRLFFFFPHTSILIFPRRVFVVLSFTVTLSFYYSPSFFIYSLFTSFHP